jgi:hypothetical protein
MAALEPVALVQFCVPGRVPISDKIGPQRGAVRSERATHKLLYLAFVKIDARPKHAAKVAGVRPLVTACDRRIDPDRRGPG